MVVGLKSGGLRYFIGDQKNSVKNVSIDEITSELTFGFYPNPVDKELHVLSPNLGHSYIITVYNPIGQVIKTVELNRGKSSTIIHFSSLNSGTYFIRLQDLMTNQNKTEVILVND